MVIRAAAIFLLVSVLLVFFIPAAAGPFSAVYGPATALRANRAAQVFYVNVALSARNPIAAVTFTFAPLRRCPGPHSGFVEGDVSAPLPALRC